MSSSGTITRIREKVRRAAYARSTAMPIERERHSCFPVTVRAVLDLGPQLRRLTLTAPELVDYRPLGPDEYFGLVMPPPGQNLPDLSGSTGANCRAALAELPETRRPDLRWYTVRAHRPALAELDLDVVTHGEDGPGSRWVRRAEAGSAAAFQTGSACYRLGAAPGDQVVVGDETALPAVEAILAQIEDSVRPHVFVEVPSADALAHPVMQDDRVHLLTRGADAPGSALLPALEAADLPELSFGWVCGEQGMVAAVRRHLVDERRLDKRSVYFCAYWIQGRPRG